MSKIPNKIHWCWLSGDDYSYDMTNKFLPSWKNFGEEYEIKLWDSKKFDINIAPKYIQDAYDDKNWAFVSDYIRAYSLYTEGGWYFDSDILIKKPLPEEWKNHNFCCTFEATTPSELLLNCLDDNGKNKMGQPIFGAGINAAMLGSVSHFQYLKDVMDYYDTLDYNRIGYDWALFGRYIAPQIYSFVMEKYGYIYDNRTRVIDDDIFIAPETLVTNKPYSLLNYKSYAEHYCTFTWSDKVPKN